MENKTNKLKHEEEITVSFIILSWNSKCHLKRGLPSIIKDITPSGYSFEILVIDNGSVDNSIVWLKTFKKNCPQLHIISLDKNGGTTAPRNLGLKAARGKFIFILDSDIEVLEQNTIQRCIELLSCNHEYGLIAPRLQYANGSHQKSVDDFPTVFSKMYRYFNLKNMELNEQRTVLKSQYVDYAISAFWAMPSSTITAVGYLDENIFYSPEDLDYCLRIWLSGRKVFFCPEIKALHHAQEISRKSFISRPMLNHISGLYYYFKKHRYFFSTRKLRTRINQTHTK